MTIRIPFISSTSPRPIEIQFTNINPVRIPISILSSTHNMTICWKSMDGTVDPSTFSVHDYFSGHHFHSNHHHPSSSHLLNSIDNVCYSYSNSSATAPINTTYYIKSEQSVILTILFERLDVGANKTEIRFITPYQVKILNIHYHGITGNLIHSYHSNQTTLTMGKYSIIDIYTYSSFQETVQIDYIASSSRLLPAIMHSPSNSESNPERKPWKSNQTDLGFLTAHIISPYLECLVPYSRLRKINLWGCTIVLLEEWLSSSTTSQPHSSPSAVTYSDEDYANYLRMLDILRPIEGDILTGRYDIAMQHIQDFRTKWLTHFPHGIPIPEFNIVFKSTVTSSPFTVSNIHIQIPLSKSSFYSNFIISPMTYSQVVFIYFVVVNPYDVVLEIKLLDDHLPAASFTEYDLDKLPDLDNYTFEEDEQLPRRDVYPFEFPERLFPYSHVPNSIGGPREIKKLFSTPSEIRDRQKIRRIQTSLSAMSSGDFLTTNDLLSPNDDDFFILKALVTIPRYMMNNFVDHPPFSRFTPSSSHVLPPHSEQLLGPIAFVPISDFESSPNDRYFNLSLYIHNNYTGIEKVDVLCPVSKIHVSVAEVEIHSLDSPELEPIPTPSSLTLETMKGFPGLITLSPTNSFLPTSSLPQSSNLPLVPSYINEVITIMANQESFTVQIYLNNTSRVHTVIDKILINGKYDICLPESLHPKHNVFPVFPKPFPVILSSSHICQSLPLVLSPREMKSLNLTFRVNCLYLSEHFTLSLLSNLYSSSRSVFLLHCSVYLTMSNHLSNFCRMSNFNLDSHFNYLLKLFGLLLLGVLSLQTHKMSVFLNKFLGEDKRRLRPVDLRNKKVLSNLRSFPHLASSNINHSSLEQNNDESFPYFRKGIQLYDIPPIIDPANCHFEAIDKLKSKRISNYYSPSPGKPLKSASSSGSISNEEINLEDIDENLRNQIVLTPAEQPIEDNTPLPESKEVERSIEDIETTSIQIGSDLSQSSPVQTVSSKSKSGKSKREKNLVSKKSNEKLDPEIDKQNVEATSTSPVIVPDVQVLEVNVNPEKIPSIPASPSPQGEIPADPAFSSDSDVNVLDFLGSEALRASVIDSIAPAAITNMESDLLTGLGDEESTLQPTEFYPPNSFDNYESHEMWEHEDPPQLSSRATSEIGFQNMVSEIFDTKADEILKSDSTDSVGKTLPNASYDDWQFQKTKDIDRIPTPPPGFAGALGTYDYFSYHQDPLSPHHDPLQVPLDPSYLRNGTNDISPSHGAIGENNLFSTPPRVLPTTPSTNSPSHNSYPQFLSLPPVLPSTDDLLGDDAEWEAMLTIPLEHMRGQVNSLSHLGNVSFGSTPESPGPSQRNPLAYYNTAPVRVTPPAPQNPSFQQPHYRAPFPNFSYDARVGGNGVIGNYHSQPQLDMYGNPLQYGNTFQMQTPTSPNRPYQGDYQIRQYNPRRAYEGTDLNGNMMYEMDQRAPYRGGMYGQQRPSSHQYGMPTHPQTNHSNYPYSQSEVFGHPSMAYHQGTNDMRLRENNAGIAPPGLSPNGGYYQPHQYSSHPSQRENNNRHNQQ